MIKIENLYAGYTKDKAIIKDINLEAEKGTVTTIVGPNGCGKSTLLKCMAKQLPPMSGSIMLEGQPVFDIKAKEFAKKLSYLKQAQNIPAISAENLVLHGRFPYMGFPRKLDESDRNIVRNAMLKTGVLEQRHKMLHELSGGECQKVYLAMALAQCSQVLLLDEPTTHLDISYQLELLSLITELKKEGKTIITVLHDINSAIQISDKIYLMNKGEVAYSGTGSDMLSSNIIDEVFNVSADSVTIKGQKQVFFKKK